MLVLTRKRGERIQIGDNIVIKVIKTGQTTVKIGIEAPSDVRVMRAELCEVDESPSAAAMVSTQTVVAPADAVRSTDSAQAI